METRRKEVDARELHDMASDDRHWQKYCSCVFVRRFCKKKVSNLAIGP